MDPIMEGILSCSLASSRGHPHFELPLTIQYFSSYPITLLETLYIVLPMIWVDIGGHPPIPTSSFWQILVQHILLYFFVILGSTLLGLSEALHIFQVETGGLPPNPTGLFWKFSCQHIFMYFQSHFGALNNFFLACHNRKDLSNRLSCV